MRRNKLFAILNKVLPVVGNIDPSRNQRGRERLFSLKEEEMHLYPDVSSTILRILLLSSAAFTVAMITPATAQQRPRLAAAQCQPLTEANFALCCIAANRTSILSAAQIDMCPPVTT
ncbi:MAG: hypothetical protein E5Y73_34935, partial [Mesorhizobium sp.]